MKANLEQLFNEFKDKCSELIEKSEKESVEEVWTLGLGNPFTLEPYRMELLGIKPGRIMKKKGEPSKSRYCNYFNKNGQLIRAKYYSQFNDTKNSWLTNEDIYIYNESGITKFVFQGVVNNECYTGLSRVVFIEYENDIPINSYQLEDDGELTKDEYLYDNDKIIEINTYWLEGSLKGYSRKYRIIHEDDDIRIISISKNGEKQIYPEK